MNKQLPQTLSSIVEIKDQFARSTRIDKDDIELSGFIYSESIDSFLRTLAKHQSASKQGAYTWTGPYGSGKSTLALSFGSILVGDQKTRKKAARQYNTETAKKIWKAFPSQSNGWKILSLVGGKSSLEQILEKKLISEGLLTSSESSEIKTPQSVQNAIISCIETYIADQKNNGIVLFIDEMGKLLEAASDGEGDVYFYQLLAEAAARSNGRFVLIGILHQTFQEYANSALKRVRDEWSKIHGRFVDININLTSFEQIELIASALSATDAPSSHLDMSQKTHDLLLDYKRSPSVNLLELLSRCWPLNPITALALGPISRRSYGQNQRSIFSFLTSGEPLGLRDFLSRTPATDQTLYSPSDLWDYLDVNWGSAIAVSGDSHHFANIKDALSRLEALEDSKPEHSRLLKTISILSLTQQLTGINPSREALQIALGLTNLKIKDNIKYLIDNSLIIFKKYKNSFSLYEGSDFNIEAEMAEALKTTSRTELSNVAAKFLPNEIIAKRHYLQFGTLRWTEISICSLEEVTKLVEDFKPNSSRFGLLLIVETENDSELLDIAKNHADRDYLVFGRNVLHTDLSDYLAEYTALNMIAQNSSSLLKDKVARREVRDRSEAIHNIIENSLIKATEDARWLINGELKAVTSLNMLASDTADKFFSKALKIKNELINRSKPSGSANAALKQLMYALVKSEGLENLGFAKFPAERGIYESVLKKNNLHIQQGSNYTLQSPLDLTEDNDTASLRPVWEDTIDFLKSESYRKVPLTEIHQRWSKPPFGIKAGIFPLLSTLLYLTNRENLAYYREDVFVTSVQDFDIDYFHKTPGLIELRWMNMDAGTKHLLSALASISAEITKQAVRSIEPLEVARALISTYDQIKPWAKRTAKVSENAKKVRALFKRASDPAQFTLNDLPSIYGEINLDDKAELANLISKIKDGLTELHAVFSETMTRFRDYTLTELGVATLSKNSLKELNFRANEIKGISGNHRTESFVLQLSQTSETLADFEKLGWRLLDKPSRDWIDPDIDRLFVETTNLSRDFKNLETMASIKGRKEASYAFALIAHSNSRSSTESPRTFELNKSELEEAKILVNKLKKLKDHKNKTPSQKSLLAALSLLVSEHKGT